MCEPNLQSLQVHCFSCLMQLGYIGFLNLIELASKDYNSLNTFILQELLNVRTIQRLIIVPSVLT